MDDVYDGVAPSDILSDDYKQVQIDVSWNDASTANPLSLVSAIVPDGIETIDTGGTVWIEVFDPTADPVSAVVD